MRVVTEGHDHVAGGVARLLCREADQFSRQSQAKMVNGYACVIYSKMECRGHSESEFCRWAAGINIRAMHNVE